MFQVNSNDESGVLLFRNQCIRLMVMNSIQRGYVDARYRDDYFITIEELKTLIERVEEMQAIVAEIGRQKIGSALT